MIITEKISTGIGPLDEALNGGLANGNLYICSSGKSAGKSSLILQMAAECAMQDKTIVIVSDEMKQDEVIRKMIAQFCVSDPDDHTILNYLGNVFVLENKALKIGDIISFCERIKEAAGTLDAVFIDKLDGVAGEKGGKSEIVKALKDFSTEKDVFVFVSSGLDMPTSTGSHPKRTFEYEMTKYADVVMMLIRNKNDVRSSLVLTKNLCGKCSNIHLDFIKEVQEFVY